MNEVTGPNFSTLCALADSRHFRYRPDYSLCNAWGMVDFPQRLLLALVKRAFDESDGEFQQL